MHFTRLVLLLSAVPFAAIGAAFVAAPARMARYVDVSISGPTADADVRAVYGGLQLACAVVLLLAAKRPDRYRFGIQIQLCLYGGLAIARLASYPLAGWPSTLGAWLHVGEVAAFAFVVAAWRRLGGVPLRDASR